MSDSFDATTIQQRKPLRISTDVPLAATSSSDSWSSSSSSGNHDLLGNPQPLHVLCMHDFESADPTHLSFLKDEVLMIVKQEHSGWWAAMRPQGDSIGWIPSSFVLPLDRPKVWGYPDESQLSYGNSTGGWGSDEPPFSTVHDPWVRVSEDSRTQSFRLLTPTDLVLFKGFSDDRVENHGYELVFNLSSDERSYDTDDACVLPTTPENPPPHRTQLSFPSASLLLEPPTLQLSRPTSPRLFDAALYCVAHPYGVDDRASLLRLTIPISPDEIVPELISGSDAEESMVVSGPFTPSQDLIGSDDETISPSKCVASHFGLPRPDHGTSDIRLLDLGWSSDSLAEQLGVLMHTHYASIRQNDCFDWMKGRRSTGMTGLRYFFDTHDQIAWWVRESIRVYEHVTQQAEALDVWIKVAEKCQTLCNFDSLCAITSALSGSLSSLRSAWVRCSHRRTFERLLDIVDVANNYHGMIDIMGVAKGPSVPFVRKCLECIKEFHVEPLGKSPCQSRRAVGVDFSAASRRMQLAAVSALLRHQSSPYGFKIEKPIHDYISNNLRTVWLTNGWRLTLGVGPLCTKI